MKVISGTELKKSANLQLEKCEEEYRKTRCFSCKHTFILVKGKVLPVLFLTQHYAMEA
jgi:hypothetical protein